MSVYKYNGVEFDPRKQQEFSYMRTITAEYMEGKKPGQVAKFGIGWVPPVTETQGEGEEAVEVEIEPGYWTYEGVELVLPLTIQRKRIFPAKDLLKYDENSDLPKMVTECGITIEADPEPAPVPQPTLEELKLVAISQTDSFTAATITGGFDHDDQRFSSSIAAQENFKGSKIKQLDGRGFPNSWSLIDGGVYIIATEADWNALYQAAENHVEATKVAGLVKRGQIAGCTTVEELNALMGW